jgi:AcrR family transcriptional regulator
VREEILSAAAALFEELGYAGTTTRKIAAQVGLQQGSIFHYFERKADILSELLYRTVEPALGFVEALDELDAPPEEQLAFLAYRDTLAICSGPHNVAGLMHLREVAAPEFAEYWEKREQLRNAYEVIVKAGLESGVFVPLPPRVLTDLVFGLVESAMFWFRRGSDEPAESATRVAIGVLRIVLQSPSKAPRIVDRVRAGPTEDRTLRALQVSRSTHPRRLRSEEGAA